MSGSPFLAVPAHCKGFGKGLVSVDGIFGRDTSGKDDAGEMGLGEAFNPSFKTACGPCPYMIVILRRGGEQIDLPEPVVLRVHRIGAIEHGLHLAAHFIVVYGRGEDQYVRLRHLLLYEIGIIAYDAAAELLAGKAALAEANVLPRKGNCGNLVPPLGGAAGEFTGKGVGIAVLSWTCGNDENLFYGTPPYSSRLRQQLEIANTYFA